MSWKNIKNSLRIKGQVIFYTNKERQVEITTIEQDFPNNFNFDF